MHRITYQINPKSDELLYGNFKWSFGRTREEALDLKRDMQERGMSKCRVFVDGVIVRGKGVSEQACLFT